MQAVPLLVSPLNAVLIHRHGVVVAPRFASVPYRGVEGRHLFERRGKSRTQAKVVVIQPVMPPTPRPRSPPADLLPEVLSHQGMGVERLRPARVSVRQ